MGVKFEHTLMRYNTFTQSAEKTIAGDKYQNIKFTGVITLQVKLALYGF